MRVAARCHTGVVPSLMCVISTGSFASRPMRRTSSKESKTLVAFVAHVADVEAIVLRGHACEVDDFFGGAGVSGVVFQSGGKTERSGFHLLCEQGFHPRDLGGRRGAKQVFAHHLLAHGCRDRPCWPR